MKCLIFIEEIEIGEANLEVIDETMGAIGGILVPFPAYQKFQHLVQDQCELKGVSNITDFNYKISTGDKLDLYPIGGIGITDMKGIDEIYIECARLNLNKIKTFK